jgi:hypothetical protein
VESIVSLRVPRGEPDAVDRPPYRPAGQWRIPLQIAAGALGLRVVSAVLALWANLAFPLYQRQQFTVFRTMSPFWDTFARYDSGYFEGIAWSGYAPLAGGRSNIAYFPVYPMLMRSIGRLFGRQHDVYYISGVGISRASTCRGARRSARRC